MTTEAKGLEIAITDYCNLNCKLCSQGTPLQKNKKHMSLADIERISSYIKPNEFEVIKISGGEPTLHPQFGEICKRLRELFPAHRYELATNGFRLERFADYLNVFDAVYVSHYPGLNDEILGHPILELDNVVFATKVDNVEMDNVYQEKNFNKENVYVHCQFSKIWKIVQGRIYPCCVIFGQSVRQNIPVDSISAVVDGKWRENLSGIDIEMYCGRCFVDVQARSTGRYYKPTLAGAVVSTEDLPRRGELKPITLFAVPKAFQGHTAVIQRNAITSWTLLEPRPEIILLGDDAGVAEIAAELGLKHVPNIKRNEYGTPLLNSIFELAEASSTTSWLVYVNSDVILMEDFVQAQAVLGATLERAGIEKFLLTSQRREIDVSGPIAFDDENWQVWLRNEVFLNGALDYKAAVEMFFFNRGLFGDIPEFGLGRCRWDNWLVWKAQQRGAAIIDATEAFKLIHQLHGYGHAKGGFKGAISGLEAERNFALIGDNWIHVNDAGTYFLTLDGLFTGRLPDKADSKALVRLRVDIGLRELEQGNYEVALDYFDDALRRNGEKFRPVQLYRARCLKRLGRLEEAQEAAKAGLARRPNDSETKLVLEEIREAIELQRRPIAVKMLQQGFEKLRSGNPLEALAVFDEAIVLCPELDNLHFAKATACVQLGKLGSAKQACLAELKIKPGHDGAKRLLERIERAIEEFEEIKAGQGQVVS